MLDAKLSARCQVKWHARCQERNEEARSCSGAMAEGMEAIGRGMAKVEKWRSRSGHGVLGAREEREIEFVAKKELEKNIRDRFEEDVCSSWMLGCLDVTEDSVVDAVSLVSTRAVEQRLAARPLC